MTTSMAEQGGTTIQSDQNALFESEFDEQSLHIGQFRSQWMERDAAAAASEKEGEELTLTHDRAELMLQRTKEYFSRRKLYLRELEQKKQFLETIQKLKIRDLPFGRLYPPQYAGAVDSLTVDQKQQIREQDIQKEFVSKEEIDRLAAAVQAKKQELKEWKNRVSDLEKEFDRRYQNVLDRLADGQNVEKEYNDLMEKCNELNDEYEKTKAGNLPEPMKESDAMDTNDSENDNMQSLLSPNDENQEQQDQEQQQNNNESITQEPLHHHQHHPQEYDNHVEGDGRQHLDNVLMMLSMLSGVSVLGVDDMINTRVIRLVLNKKYPVDIWCNICRMPISLTGSNRQRTAALDQMLETGEIDIDSIDVKEHSLAAAFDDIIEVAKQMNDLCFLCTELRERLIQLEEQQQQQQPPS